MPDNESRIRELRAKLREIVPQADDRSSARELARWFAAEVQVSYALDLTPFGPPPDLTRFQMMCARFAACHALEALRERDTAHADEVAAQITQAFGGEGIGEWTWEHLGEDAQAVADIADELARLSVAGEAVAADA